MLPFSTKKKICCILLLQFFFTWYFIQEIDAHFTRGLWWRVTHTLLLISSVCYYKITQHSHLILTYFIMKINIWILTKLLDLSSLTKHNNKLPQTVMASGRGQNTFIFILFCSVCFLFVFYSRYTTVNCYIHISSFCFFFLITSSVYLGNVTTFML